MKLIPVLLIVGLLAVIGCSKEDKKPEPYSAELVKKAEVGDARAQNDLGLCYLNGDGVTQDYKESMKWSLKSIESFHAQMEKTVEASHAQMEKALSATMQIYKPELVKKAEAGDANAQNDLASCYYNGKGVTQDDKEAVKWWTRGAEQGNARAQYRLGLCYLRGEGLAKDEKEAVKWFAKSVEKGNATAQYNLALCYANGQGVGKDEKEAVKWFAKSAEQGNATAQYNLGVCYANGQGVGKDEKEAVKWLRKSAEQGLPEAKEAIEKLKSK